MLYGIFNLIININIIGELFFQMPFFVVALYGLWNKKNWVRIPSIVYGSHVSTTVIPILFEFFTSKLLKMEEKFMLFVFYSPFLFIPLMLTIYMSLHAEPFVVEKQKSRRY